MGNRTFFKSLRAKGFEDDWLKSSPAFLGITSDNDSVQNSKTSNPTI